MNGICSEISLFYFVVLARRTDNKYYNNNALQFNVCYVYVSMCYIDLCFETYRQLNFFNFWYIGISKYI